MGAVPVQQQIYWL